MPSAYGALTETVGCRLVGPTPRTLTGFGYADGGSGTPTGVNADGKTPTAAVGVSIRQQRFVIRRRLPCVSRSDITTGGASRGRTWAFAPLPQRK